MPSRASLLVDTAPPRPQQPQLRAGKLTDSVTDLLAAVSANLRYLLQLLVWLQQQFAGIRNGLFDTMVTWEPLVGARDSVNTAFTITAGTIRTGVNTYPQALLFQGGVPIPYTATNPPPAGAWTVVNQQFILGTPPTGVPGDDPVVCFVIVQ